jgi:ATP-dependent DNA helicase RecQ
MQRTKFKNEGKVDSTINHLFFTSKGQKRADQLLAGDLVYSSNTINNWCDTSEILSVSEVEYIKPIKRFKTNFLYDIEVETNHNYFVTAQGTNRSSVAKHLHTSLLVHNCCSSWGDFRPDYQKIYKIREYYPNATVLAVTATADEKIRKDIVKYIGIKPDHKLFITSFDRSSINYNILPKKTNGHAQVAKLIDLNGKDAFGIIYCASQKSTEQLSEYLNKLGYSSSAYHASIKNKKHIKEDGTIAKVDEKKLSDVKFKQYVQEQFITGKVKIICATIAFGMGIDKANVKFVIHLDPPTSMDGYSQEVGRASRNGMPASAYLLYDSASYSKSAWLLRETTRDPDRLAIRLGKLKQVHEFCKSRSCRRASLLNYFGENYDYINCNSCDICGCDMLNTRVTNA